MNTPLRWRTKQVGGRTSATGERRKRGFFFLAQEARGGVLNLKERDTYISAISNRQEFPPRLNHPQQDEFAAQPSFEGMSPCCFRFCSAWLHSHVTLVFGQTSLRLPYMWRLPTKTSANKPPTARTHNDQQQQYGRRAPMQKARRPPSGVALYSFWSNYWYDGLSKLLSYSK